MVRNLSYVENRDIIPASDSRCAWHSGPALALRMKKLGSGERLSNLFTGVPDQASGRSSLSPGPSWPLSSAAHCPTVLHFNETSPPVFTMFASKEAPLLHLSHQSPPPCHLWPVPLPCPQC